MTVAGLLGFSDKPSTLPAPVSAVQVAQAAEPVTQPPKKTGDPAADGAEGETKEDVDRYYNAKDGYSIQLPEGCEQKKKYLPEAVFGEHAGTEDGHRYELRILMHLKPEASPVALWEKLLPSLRETRRNFREVKRSELTIDGKPAVSVVYQFHGKFNGKPVDMTSVDYIVGEGKRFAILRYSGYQLLYEVFKEPFEASAVTFRFAREGDPPPPTGVVPEPRTWRCHGADVFGIKFSPDGTQIASTGENVIEIWDAASGKLVKSLKGHRDTINGIAYSPDGKRLASAGGDNTVRIWDVKTGKPLFVLERRSSMVKDVAFSPDGKQLVSGVDFCEIDLWDALKGTHIRTLGESTEGAQSVAFHPNGKLVASASSKKVVKLWDLATGKLTKEFTGHTDVVRGIAFNPDGKSLVSSSEEAVKLWDVATAKLVWSSKTESGGQVLFSPDGKWIASLDTPRIRIWDSATGVQVRTINGPHFPIESLAFGPDGKHLATGHIGNEIRVWDLSRALPAKANKKP